MPAIPKRITLGPFLKGLNQYSAANLLEPSEPRTANNVDLQDGTLRASYGAGTQVAATATAQGRDIHYADGPGWLPVTNFQRFFCDDSVNPVSGKRWCYYTHRDAGGTPVQAAYVRHSALDGGAGYVSNVPLGVPSPAVPTGSGVGTGSRSYRVTYVVRMDGLSRPTRGTPSTDYYAFPAIMESNPSPIISGNFANISIPTMPVPTAPTFSAFTVDEARIYATLPGATDGLFYFLGRVTGFGGPVAIPTLPAGTATYLLNWDVGGGASATTYKYDYSPAPVLTVMAEAMHSLVGSSGGGSAYVPPASGILFGANGATLLWSQMGYAWRWPVANSIQLDDYIEAIIPDQATTYVITRSSVYVITGIDDQNLSIVRSTCPYGAALNTGKAAVLTPYGLLYVGKTSVIHFDGQRGLPLTLSSLGSLLPFTSPGTFIYGAFQDGQYLFGNSAFCYILGLGRWPEVQATTSTVHFTCATTTTLDPGAGPGTYIELSGGSGSICPLMPWRRGDITGAARRPWDWQSGHIDLGMPTAYKRFIRVWIDGADQYTVTVTGGTNQAPASVTQTLTGSDWLGSEFEGITYLQVECKGVAFDYLGVIYGITIECEVYDDGA